MRHRTHRPEDYGKKTILEMVGLHSAILDALPAYLALLDQQGLILTVNETWKRFADANAFVGANFGVGANYMEVCEQARVRGECSEEAGAIVDGIRSVLAGAVDNLTLEYACHSSQEVRWFQVRVNRLLTEEAAGAVVAHVNITDRKLAEEALRESEMRYRLLSDAVPEIIYTTTSDGRCDYTNQRWQQYTGVPFEATRDFNWVSCIHGDDILQVLNRWQEAVQTGQSFEFEYRIRRADGVYRWFLGRNLPMRDAGGQIVKWFGTCTDIGDQKRVAEALEQQVHLETCVWRRVEPHEYGP